MAARGETPVRHIPGDAPGSAAVVCYASPCDVPTLPQLVLDFAAARPRAGAGGFFGLFAQWGAGWTLAVAVIPRAELACLAGLCQRHGAGLVAGVPCIVDWGSGSTVRFDVRSALAPHVAPLPAPADVFTLAPLSGSPAARATDPWCADRREGGHGLAAVAD